MAYHGDVLNTTARMLSKFHELSSELLVSEAVLKQVELPKYLKADQMGTFQIKGKLQEMELYSVYLSKNRDALIQHRRRFFIRKREKSITK